MEWFDYEALNKLKNDDSEEKWHEGVTSPNRSTADYNYDGNSTSSSDEDEKGERSKARGDPEQESVVSKGRNKDDSVDVDQATLDDIFQSLAVNMDLTTESDADCGIVDIDAQSNNGASNSASVNNSAISHETDTCTKEDKNGEGQIGDEQTISTAKSGKSQRSARSATSRSSRGSRSSISLTEQLEKISNDTSPVKTAQNDEERSVSAKSWFSWRGKGSSNASGTASGSIKDTQELQAGQEVQENQSKSGTQATSTDSLACDNDDIDLDLDDPLDKSNIDDYGQLLGLDLGDNDLINKKEAGEEHPNQALFDIIEQGFDTIESFYVKGLVRALKAAEVKLCFAAYIFVFTPPEPTSLALQYNHDIDENLREERQQRQKQKDKKKGWFKWGSGEDSTSFQTLKNNALIGENEKYVYEIVPSVIVFSLWTEVLKRVGIKLSKLSRDAQNAILNYLKEALVQVGLLDTSMIDVSRKSVSGGQAHTNEENLCEYIAAHQSINGQYGHYLRRSYKKIRECLERNSKSIFNAVSGISDEGNLTMRDYCVGMLPYSLAKAQKFTRVEKLLCEESFVQRRLDYFGILEGTTVQVTDIELIIEVGGDYEGFNVEDTMRRAYSSVKAYIDKMDKASAEHNGMFYEEIGKALHLLAVSFISQGLDGDGLEYLSDALDMKERKISQYDEEVGTITLSDTLHCIGHVHEVSGDFDKSLSSYTRALLIRRALLDSEDLRVAETCQSMGSALCEVGEIDNAQRLLEEALRIRKHNLEEGHGFIAESEEWMGNVLREQGDFDRALECFKSALQAKKKNFGNDHEEVANTMYNLAITLDRMGNYDVSIQHFKEALRIRNAVYGRGLVLADTYLCMGNTYLELGKHSDAFENFKESITIREHQLKTAKETSVCDISLITEIQPPEKSVVLQYSKLIECYEAFYPLYKRLHDDSQMAMKYLCKMGECYFNMLDYDHAMGRYQAALDIGHAIDGVELRQKIGQIYIATEEYSEAQSILIQCLTSQKTEHGEDSPILFETMYYLGITLDHMNKHEHSLAIFLKCAEVLDLSDVSMKTKVANTDFWIGRQHHALGEYSDAVKHFVRALAGYKEVKDLVQIDVILQTLHCLGNAHAAQDRLEMALKAYEGEIHLFGTIDDLNSNLSYAFAEAQFCAGSIYAKMNAYDNAKSCYERTLGLLPKGHNEKIALTLDALGTIHMKEGFQDDAVGTLTGAFNMYKESVGETRDGIMVTAFKLAQLHDQMKDFNSAMNYYKICLSMRETKYGKHHKEVGTILFYMGKNCFLRSEFGDALVFLERALNIKKKQLPPNDQSNASTFYELARCYVAKDMTDKATLCYKEAFRIWKANKMPKNAGAAAFDLATLYEEQQQNALAAKSYRDCLDHSAGSNELTPLLHYRLGILYTTLENNTDAILHYTKYISLLGSDVSRDETYFSSMRALAQLHAKDGEYEESFAIYDELIQFMEIDGSPSQHDLASIYHEEGKVHFELDHHDEALESLKTSLRIRKSMDNQEIDHNEIGQVLLDLTKVYEAKDDFLSASNSLLEALFIFKFKRNDNDRITALLHLGKLHEKMGKMDEAKECYEDCLALQTSLTFISENETAKTMFRFGSLLLSTSEEERALALFQKALKVQEKSPGTDDHLATLQKIGEIQMQRLLYSEALDTLKETIRLWSDGHEEESADCNRNVGVIYAASDDYMKAEPYLKEAVKLYKKSGVDDERLSSSLHHYAQALLMTSSFSLAREHVLEALSLRKIIPGPGSLEYAQSLTCLGEIEFGDGSPGEGLQNLLKALDIYRSCKGEVIFESVRIQELVGRIFFRRKDYDNARQAVEACIMRTEEKFPDEIEFKSNLFLLGGKIQAAQNNFSAAYDQFKRCLSLRKRDGKERQTVLEVLLEIGSVLFEQEQFKSCLSYYQESLRIKRLLGEADSATSIQSQIGIANLNIGKFEDAMRTFKEIRSFYNNSIQNVDQRQGDLAHLAYHIGRAHSGLEQSNEALASYLEAVSSFGLFMSNSDSKKDKVIMASAMFNAAHILAQQGQEPGRALEFFEKALVLRREHLDKFNPDLADNLYWLAKTLGESDEIRTIDMFAEAEQIYNRCQKNQQQAACLSELGLTFLNKEIEKSFSYYKKAWSIYLAHDLDRGIDAANILYGMGFIHNQRLQSQKSCEVLKECLKIRIREEGKNSLNVGKTCEQLGSCLLSLGQHEDSLKLYVTSLEIYKQILGESTAACARVMIDIATLYSYKQQFDLALVQLTACLDFMETEHGKESEEVASVLLRIGQIHDMRVDNEEAMKCVSRALEIRIKLYTKEDIRVAETYLICGKLLEDWGDIDEAMNCFQSALLIFQLKKGVEDTQVATIHDQIAGIYVEKGNYDAAIESYNEALSLYQVQLGERSSEVGHTLRNLGAIFDSKKDLETSYKYYMDALKILRQSLGDNDLSVGLVLNNIGINLARRKKYRKAIDLCTVALRIRRSQLPKNHLEIADTLINLANILDDCNKDSQALKFYKEALSVYKANFGSESEDVANSLKSIGYINIRQGEIAEAIDNLSEALRIFRMKQGLDSLDVSDVLYHLGRIYGKKAEFEKSLGCFRESLRIRKILLPADHRNVVDTERFVEAIRRKVEGGIN